MITKRGVFMKCKRKSILIGVFLIVVFILFVLTLAFWLKTKPRDSYINAKTIFTEDLKKDIKEIICPLNEKSSIVTDCDTIEDVFSLLQSVKLKPTDDEGVMGYYMIQMNTDNDTIFLSINNSEFVINRKHYKVNKDISDEIYTLLFDNN